jgi:hypothetical protein
MFRNGLHNPVVPPLLGADDIVNTASSTVECWTVRMFTGIPILLRNPATDCSPRTCLRGNLFTNPLPGIWKGENLRLPETLRLLLQLPREISNTRTREMTTYAGTVLERCSLRTRTFYLVEPESDQITNLSPYDASSITGDLDQGREEQSIKLKPRSP